MKSSELRVGNWAMGAYGKAQKVAYVGETIGLHNELGGTDKYQKDPIISFDIDTLLPIPLTPEIVEKAGFEMVDLPPNFNEGRNGYQVIIQPSARRYLLISGSGIFWFASLYDSGNVFNGKSVSVVSYLHQLQNLYFALTGEELNIEL